MPHFLTLKVALNPPFVPPVSRNDISDRITPKTSVWSSVCTLPVFGSGRTSSKLLPLLSRISCCLVPAKQPWTACVMPVARCRIKLYRYIAVFVLLQTGTGFRPNASSPRSGCFVFSSLCGRENRKTKCRIRALRLGLVVEYLKSIFLIKYAISNKFLCKITLKTQL